MKAFRTLIIIFIITVFTFIINSDVMAQCVMCKGAISEKVNSGESNFGEGLNNGILYLMSFPYIIFGVIAFFWYKESRKTTDKQNSILQVLKSKFIGK